MNYRARLSSSGIGDLGAGAAVQILSYLGIFLALYVADKLLTPVEFGLYAGLTTTASLLGTTFTFGADKMLVNLAARNGTRRFRLSSPARYQWLFFGLANALVVLGGLGAYASGLMAGSLMLTLMLSCVIALKMVLGGHLRGSGQMNAGLVGIFSLQPLILGILFGIGTAFSNDFPVTLEAFLVAAVVIEVGFVVWFVSISRAGSLRFNRQSSKKGFYRQTKAHAEIAMRITTWSLLAQSPLLSVAIATAAYPPVQVAQYGLAIRVAQIILMPWSSGIQTLIPKLAKFDKNRPNEQINKQNKTITRAVFAAVVVIALGYVTVGHFLMSYFFEAFDYEALKISIVLLIGYLIFAFFGSGDQGLIAVNYYQDARFITFITTTLALLGYAACVYWKADIIYIAVIMAGTTIARQIWCERRLSKLLGFNTRVSL